MVTSNFIVRIPEPCHEDWNKMQPDAKGKFCNSCSKAVFDFSNKTDTEIKDILIEYKHQKVCGHFKKSQVNRPLSIVVNLRDLPKNITITKAFGIALFLVFGTFLFSCTDERGQKVNEIKIDKTEMVDSRDRMAGMILAEIPPLPVDSPLENFTTTTGDMVVEMREEYIDGGIGFEEMQPNDSLVRDSVNLEEIVVVDYLTPLIDPGMMTGSVSATTGLVSVSFFQSDSIVENNTFEPIINKSELGIYPNPSSGEFTIKYTVKKKVNVLLEIYDMKGILIKSIVDVSNQYEGNYQIPVNLSELTNGIYLVNLIKGDTKFLERLVIKK